MTEELSYKVTTDAAQAAKEIDRATTSVAGLSGAANYADKNLQSMEKNLAKAGVAAKQYAKDLGSVSATALNKTISDMAALEKRTASGKSPNQQAYAQQVASQTGYARQAATQEEAIRAKDLAGLRGAIVAREQQYQHAASEQVKYARQAASQEEQIRQRDLASLRDSIQQRNAASSQKNAAQLGYAQQGIAQTGVNRQGELSSLRSSIIGRYAAEDAKIAAGNQRVTASFQGMASARYAMYDVARSLTVVSAATLGTATAVVKLEADYEQLLVQVKRTSQTSGSEWQTLRKDLIDLSTQIPASMKDISDIATLAGQLGIASGDIDSFTESVVKFSAVTGVSASSSAESLGRIAQLSGATGDEYDNLTASIYQVGVTSLSTEADILAVAQQIAVSGRQAGFATEQTIALASALASVGVAPERARGSIQRVFNIITNSVDNADASLAVFAKYSNQTADEFAQTWKGDPQTAFLSFLEGLGKAGESGQNMNNILAEVGINAVRDTDALKRLAQNTEVYTSAIDQASQGWNDGAVMADGYGEKAATLSSKLEVLSNRLKAIVESVQDNSALKQFVDLLILVAGFAKRLLDNPIGKFFAGVALFVGVLVGALAALGAGAAAAFGSLLAMVTALTFLQREAGANVGVFNLLKISILQYTGAMKGAEIGAIEAAVAQGQFRNVLLQSAAAGGTLSKSMTAVKASIAATGVGIAVLVVAGIATKIWSDRQAEAAKNAAQLEAATTSLSSAIDADTAKYNALSDSAKKTAEGYTAIERKVATTSDALTNTTDTTNELLGSNIDLKESITGVTEAFTKETIALGALSQQAFVNSVAKSLFPDDASAEDQAATLTRVRTAISLLDIDIEKLNATTSRGDTSYLDQLKASIAGLSADLQIQGVDPLEIQADLEAIDSFIGAYEKEGTVLSTLTGKKELAISVDDALGSSTAGVAEELAGAAEEAVNLADGLFAVINAQSGLIGASYDLGGALQENGLSFDTFSAGGRANIAALSQAISAAAAYAGDDTALFASSVEQIISQLEAAGAVGARQIANASGALSVGKGNATTNTQALVVLAGQVASGYGDAAKNSEKTAKNTGSAAKQARTLKDYVSDLSGVFKDAFDFRFGFANSQDDTSRALRKIGDSLKDAADKARDLNNQITDLNATLSGLSADRAILQYQLSIATEYGDTLRVQAIMAELDKNAADTAKSQADLTDTTASLAEQQDYLTKNLDGSTKSSEDHRAMVQDLLSAYEDQIAAYAKTGASQIEIARYSETLKTKFQDQLRALGYNTVQTQKYVAAFDDLKRIIDKIPRNLTVTTDANTDPAQAALDEFFTKNTNRSVNVGVTGDTSGLGRLVARSSLAAQIIGLTARIGQPGLNGTAISAMESELNALTRRFNALPAYDKGGQYPGGWALVGETGPELINFGQSGYVYTAAQTQQMMASERGGGSTTQINVGGGSSVVDLSAGSIQRIAQAVQPLIELDGQRVARSTNRNNRNLTRTGSN